MPVFLDASYLLAVYMETDVHHKRAVELSKAIDENEYGLAVTSADVFDEVLSVTLRKFGKESSKTVGRQIKGTICIIHADIHTFEVAYRIFDSSNEPFSFTDCTTQAIMRMGQIRRIATFDRLFEKLDLEVIA